MPAIFGVFLVLLVAFQLFFRYESWPSKDSDGVIYERDRLSGETHKLAPGDKVGIIARLTGDFGSDQSGENTTNKSDKPPAKKLAWIPEPDKKNASLESIPQPTEQKLVAYTDNTYSQMADTQSPYAISTSIETQGTEATQTTRHLNYKRQGAEIRQYQNQAKTQPVDPVRTIRQKPSQEPVYQMNMVATSSQIKAGQTKSSAPTPDTPSENQAKQTFRAIPLVASAPTPAPLYEPSSRPAGEIFKNTSSQNFDLNHDGYLEQIIQTQKSDGTVVISVVWQGRELFFAQGQQLQILPSRTHGWSDLAMLSGMGNQKWYFQFDPKSEAYIKKQILPLRPTLASGNSHF